MRYAAIYLRVSTEEQAKKGYSIEAQREKLEAYCKKRKWGYSIFEDAGFSAGSLNRPSIQLLIEEIKAAKVDKVVVWKLDRLSRRMKDLYTVLSLLEKHDVELVSITENIVTNSSLGKFLTGILGSVAELEREQIRERIRSVKDTRKRVKRLPLGHPPLGYRRGFEIAPEEALVVKEIFELAQFMGPTGIARVLNRKGLKTRDGNTWSRVAVRRILDNETYAGIIRLEDGNYVEGNYEPIISRDLFEKTHKRFKRRSGRKSATSKHLLSGVMVCGLCGKTMGATGDYKAGKRFYTCLTKISYDAQACPNRRFRADYVESELKRRIAEYAGKERARVFEKIQAMVAESQLKELKTQKRDLDNALSNIKTRISRLYELFEEERVDKPGLLARMDELKKKREEFENKRIQVEKKIQNSDPKKMIELLQEAFDRFEELWEVSNATDRKALLRTMVDSLVAYPEKIVVQFRWGQEDLIPYPRRKMLIELDAQEREFLQRLRSIQARIVLLADEGLMGKEISEVLNVDYSKVIWVLGQFRKRRLKYIENARGLKGPQRVPDEVQKILLKHSETVEMLKSPGELMKFLRLKGVVTSLNMVKNIFYKTR